MRLQGVGLITCACQMIQSTIPYTGGSSFDATIGGTQYEYTAIGKSGHFVPCAMCYVSTTGGSRNKLRVVLLWAWLSHP